MRKIFIQELVKLNGKKKKIYLVINDLGFNVIEPFKNKFPKHFFNAGVSEQSMMGLSAGIASEKCHTFVYSIANFTALTNFSPTTEPIEPPKNEYSNAHTITGIFFRSPLKTNSASFSPVLS